MTKKYYLAAPYTGTPEQIKYRMRKVNEAACNLMKMGKLVLSPLSHGESISKAGNLPTDWNYWKKMCEWQMSTCTTLLVLKLDGWRTSVGVQAEIEYAIKNNMDIMHINIDTSDVLKDN